MSKHIVETQRLDDGSYQLAIFDDATNAVSVIKYTPTFLGGAKDTKA